MGLSISRMTYAKRARAKVQAAIKKKQLINPKLLKCVDCKIPATEYEHRDYRKPLEVEPICHTCNMLRGAALPFEAEAPPRRPPEKCKLGHEFDGIRSRRSGGRYCKTCVALSKRKQRAAK